MDRDSLSCLVNRNYHSIKSAATRLVKSSYADDLISETYVTIERRNSQLPENDDEFIKVFVTLMKIQTFSERDGFLKLTRPKEKLVNDFSYITENEDKITDVEGLLAQINKFKSKLNAVELELFKLCFEEGLTLTKIVELYSAPGYEMSFNCLWKMYEPLKKKIDKNKWIF